MSYSRRLAALERVFSNVSIPEERGGADTRAFVVTTLRAIGSIRREHIDDGRPEGYNTARLCDLNPFELAAYLAALRLQEHPDEAEARRLLRGAAEEERLLRLVDNVVRWARSVAA